MAHMNDMNSDFDPTLPTDRQPVTEWDQPMDEADSYVDWDEVSDADADWRWEESHEYLSLITVERGTLVN
jgi:hypothetical protein